MLLLGVLVGCGGPTAPAAPAPDLPTPPTPAASAPAPASASASAGSAATPAAGSSAAPATSAHKTDVLLDTKLPPKPVTAGGSYSIAVNDSKGYTRAEVVSAVEKSSKTVDACFGDIFKAGGKAGKISFSVVIDSAGKFKSTKPQGDELKDKKLPKCLENALKKVEWAKPSEKDGASFIIEWQVQS